MLDHVHNPDNCTLARLAWIAFHIVLEDCSIWIVDPFQQQDLHYKAKLPTVRSTVSVSVLRRNETVEIGNPFQELDLTTLAPNVATIRESDDMTMCPKNIFLGYKIQNLIS